MAVTSVAGPLAGGLGLFLLGLWLATDGVKLAGGSVLKANLRTWARTRWRAFETGFAIALLVPSSSQLNRAAIGFVNCGLVSLANALWLVVGCSFGAVITAWLVVAVGFGPDLFAQGLFTVGLGVLLRWTGPHTRRGAWGQALAGLGLLLLGVSILASGFASIDPAYRLESLPLAAGTRIALCVVAGAAAVALLRSASAAVALVLVAASAGFIATASGAALLVGVNLGASTDAALTLLSGTPSAKRVASANVVFHVLTSALGLVLLRTTLGGIDLLTGALGGPPFALAVFLTLSLGLGALALWPLATPLTRLLEDRFRGEERDLGRPHNLDPSALAVPDLALESLIREVCDIGSVARDLTRTALRGGVLTEFRSRHDADSVARLVGAVDRSLARLYRGELPAQVADILVEIPRASQAFRELCSVAERLRSNRRAGADLALDPRLRTRLNQLQSAVLHLLEGCDPFAPDFSLAGCRGERAAIEGHVGDARRRLFASASRGELAPSILERVLDRLEALRRVGQVAVAAAESLERARYPRFRRSDVQAEDLDATEPSALQAA